MARPSLLPLLGLTTLLISTACAISTLLLAIALSLTRSSISPLALTAGILDVLGIGWIAYLLANTTGTSITNPRRRTRNTVPTIALLPSMLLSSIAGSLTFGTLIWIHTQPSESTGTIFGASIQILDKVAFAFWAAAIVSQSAFVALCFHDQQDEPTGNRVSIIRDMMAAFNTQQDQPQAVPVPMPMQNLDTIPPPMAHYARSIASSQSNATSFDADGKSVHSNFHGNGNGVRTVTSRSRLIKQKSWAGPSSSGAAARAPGSRHGSLQESRRSSVERDVVEEEEEDGEPATPLKTRLETIPGSRANSPARVLDGPFTEQDEDEEDDGAATAADASEQTNHNRLSNDRRHTASSVTASVTSQPYEKEDPDTESPFHLEPIATTSPLPSPSTEHSPVPTLPHPYPQLQQRNPPLLRTSSFSHPQASSTDFLSRRPSTSNTSPTSFFTSTALPSPTGDESHIHPLFRTDSPLPPPTATSGTMVHASAFAGHYVRPGSVRAASRERSGVGAERRPSTAYETTLSTRPSTAAGGAGSANAEDGVCWWKFEPEPLRPDAAQHGETQAADTAAATATDTVAPTTATSGATREPTQTALALAPPGTPIIVVATQHDAPPQLQAHQQQQQTPRRALGEISSNTGSQGRPPTKTAVLPFTDQPQPQPLQDDVVDEVGMSFI